MRSGDPTLRTQLNVLFERNVAVLIGSPGRLFVLLIQPPLIGGLVGLAWGGTRATSMTFFILSLAAIYLGCLNACTAIVRERAIYERERMTGLSIVAFVCSKLMLLTWISLVQALTLLWTTAQWVRFETGIVEDALLFLYLVLTGIAASALGLLISAWSRSPTTAVIGVPVIMLPQIIFSKTVLGSRVEDVAALSVAGKATLTWWSHDALQAAGLSWSWGAGVFSPLVLIALAGACIGLAMLKLRLDEG